MDKFVSSIKRKYLERLINREKQWPPCHSNKLIKLELVEQEKGKGYFASQQLGVEDEREKRHTFLAYSDLFKVDSQQAPVRKVLVEGDAGIGKTTLCTAASEDWAKGSHFQQFELVLLLPLRYKEIASAGSLSELLKLLHSSASVRDSVVSHLEDEEGEKVLIIADGWDELGESERQEDSFLFSLFFKQFPFLSVVLTSRPSASSSFHRSPYIDRFVAVRGFSNADIRCYIQSEFDSDGASGSDKADRLLQELTNNSLVESICTIPLNCAIVCHLWRTLEEALPTTMTGLYTKIILNILLRSIQKIKAYEHISELSSFDALPKGLKESWLLLCEFAFHTKKRDQIVFSQQELSKCLPQGLAVDENVLCFGLLQHTEVVFETGRKMAFHFLHLTFQEYLAALHLIRQPTDYKLKFFRLINSYFFGKIYSVILRFYFGNEKSESRDFGDQLILSLKEIHGRYNPLHFHFAFEATSQQIIDAVINFLCVPIEQSYFLKSRNYNIIRVSCNIMFQFQSPLTAYDYAAMMYVMKASVQKSCKMGISFHSASIGEKQIKTLANILSDVHKKHQVTYFNLSDNKISDKSITDLFSRAAATFTNSLTALCLSGNNIGADSIKAITRALERAQSSKLLTLDLSKNNLGISGLQALEDLVRSGSLGNLVDLNLQESLNFDMDTNSAVIIGTFFEALSTNCHHIRLLDISKNPIPDDVPVMSALSRLVSQYHLPEPHLFCGFSSEDLKGLIYTLNGLNISDRGLAVFANGLSNLSGSTRQFQWLHLTSNRIQAIGISHLNRVKNLIVECITLGNNPLGLQGTLSVGELLSNNFGQVRRLGLSRCQLTVPCGDHAIPSINLDSTFSDKVVVDIGQQLCQLPQNCTITSLGLEGNCFNGPGIYILAGFICLCSCLKYLDTYKCGITSNDLRQLFNILSEFKALTYKLNHWGLRYNKIDDDGTYTLMEHLPSLFPSLTSVNIIDNQVSDQAKAKMENKVIVIISLD